MTLFSLYATIPYAESAPEIIFFLLFCLIDDFFWHCCWMIPWRSLWICMFFFAAINVLTKASCCRTLLKVWSEYWEMCPTVHMLLNTMLLALQIRSYISECLNSCEHWAKEMQIAVSILMIFLLRWCVHLSFYNCTTTRALLLNNYHNSRITVLYKTIIIWTPSGTTLSNL